MLAIAATLVVAASVANPISSGCISTLTSLALTPAGDCLNIAGLISLATLSSSSSIVPSIDTWVTGLCAITSPSKCTNSTLLALGTNITDSCGSDITNAGIPSDIVNQLPELLQQYYAVGIEAFCTRDTSSNKLCVTSELTILQNSIGGSLTMDNVATSALGVLSNTTLEKELACTTCAQGMYTIIRPELSSSLQSVVDSDLNGMCGNGFVTPTLPTQIIVATGTLATQTPMSTHSGAASSFALPRVSAALLVSTGTCLLGSVFGGMSAIAGI